MALERPRAVSTSSSAKSCCAVNPTKNPVASLQKEGKLPVFTSSVSTCLGPDPARVRRWARRGEACARFGRLASRSNGGEHIFGVAGAFSAPSSDEAVDAAGPMKYTCHEDGLEFDDLERLQRHLKSKVSLTWSSVGDVPADGVEQHEPGRLSSVGESPGLKKTRC